MDKQSSLFVFHELDRVVHTARSAVERLTDQLESVPEQMMSWLQTLSLRVGHAVAESIYEAWLANQAQPQGRPCCAAQCWTGPPGDELALSAGAELHAMVLHAEADEPLVHGQLLPALRRQGLRVATMPDVLQLGLEMSTAMERGLARARHFLVMMSRAFLAASSERARLESSAMLQRRGDDLRSGGHSIIPLYVEDRETLPELPSSISGLVGMSFAKATSPEGIAQLVQRLAAPDE